MAVWTSKVTIDNITSTYPGPGPFGYVGPLSTFQYYAFIAADLVDLRYPTIRVLYRINATGTALETVEEHGFSIGGDLNNFVPGGVGHEFTGTNEFETGGLFTVIKDETLDEYQFSSPLGSSAFTFASLGGANDGELAPDSLWLSDLAVATYDDALLFNSTDQDTTLTVHFANFFGQLNGTDIKGATLATGDRGSWEPPSPSTIFDPWIVTFTATMSAATADTGGEIGFAFSTNVAGSPPAPSGVARRFWDQSVYLVTHNPFTLALDAVLCPLSGNLYVLRVANTEPTQVFFARSEDRGATWQEQVLDTIGGAAMAWPTLDVNPEGKIVALWQDRTDPTRQYWAISETYGKTWSTVQNVTGVEFSVSRARFHPMTGWLFFVFRDVPAGQFKVIAHHEVSLAGFTPAAPWAPARTIVNATADNWPTVNFDQRGEVQLQWTEMQRTFSLSENLGVGWTTSMSEPMSMKAQPSVINDPVSGLQYVLHQHPSTGDLSAFASDDGGMTALVAGPSGTVEAGADQQYAAVVTDHRGHVYAIFQELVLGSYAIRCRRSDSLSADWVNA